VESAANQFSINREKLMKRLVLLTTAIGLGLTALAAPAMAENTLRWTSQGDALTLDPHSQNEGPTIAMSGQMYERLVNRDPDLALVPELATSWVAIEPTVFSRSTALKLTVQTLRNKLLLSPAPKRLTIPPSTS